MIVTDYNKMNVEEIFSIYENLNVTFLIEDGKIVKAN